MHGAALCRRPANTPEALFSHIARLDRSGESTQKVALGQQQGVEEIDRQGWRTRQGEEKVCM